MGSEYRINNNSLYLWEATKEDFTTLPDYEQDWFSKYVPAEAKTLPPVIWRELYGDYLRYGEVTEQVLNYLGLFTRLMRTDHHAVVMEGVTSLLYADATANILAARMNSTIVKASTRLPTASLDMRKSIVIRLNVNKALNKMKSDPEMWEFSKLFVLSHILILNAETLLPEVLDDPGYPEVYAKAQALVTHWESL